MNTIFNPILLGFNPDPCLIFVEDRFYLATSTFEWFPGVRIHESQDLQNWNLLGYALHDPSQLNLLGVPDSGGVWAPDLSYDGKYFYLCHTLTRFWRGAHKDCHNYISRAQSILGPWSQPVYVNSSGFDPSLFHDPVSGNKYFLNMVWNHRLSNPFAGISLQQWCPEQQILLGEPSIIWEGSPLGCTEGPHLYFYNHYYYLVTAEGGTGRKHAVSVCRSKNITGPYELSPLHPLFSASAHPAHPLQKTGHASLVCAYDTWYMAMLCARPNASGKCPLGRETAIEEVIWNSAGWLEPASHSPLVRTQLTSPILAQVHHLSKATSAGEPFVFIEDFKQTVPSLHWQSLRQSVQPTWLECNPKQGLVLKGGDSLNSTFHVSMLAYRVQHHQFQASTRVRIQPQSEQHGAGFTCFYDTANHAGIFITRDAEGFEAVLFSTNRGDYCEHERIPLQMLPQKLLCRWHDNLMYFGWIDSCEHWFESNLTCDLVADEQPIGIGGFTGAMLGLFCVDGTRTHSANFWDFSYKSY
jgi:xylan 1,4-beta-xylosidase